MSAAAFDWVVLLWAKAGLILLFALLADRLLRRAPAHSRHALWTGVSVLLIVLPALGLVLPELPLPRLGLADAVSAESASSPAGAATDGSTLPAERFASTSLTDRTGPGMPIESAAMRGDRNSGADGGWLAAETAPSAQETMRRRVGAAAGMLAQVLAPLFARLRAVVPVVWAAGALLALALLGLSHHRAARLMRGAGDLLDVAWRTDLRLLRQRLRMQRPVRLRWSHAVATPMAGGLRRGTVLVPDRARRWGGERRRLVLLHELVHLDRRDPLRHLIARLALAMYWAHPLAWLAARCAYSAREESCDERVLELGTRPSEYARELVALHESLDSPYLAPAAALPLIQRSLLEKRIMNVLRTDRRPLGRVATAVGLTVALVAALSVAAAQPQQVQDDQEVRPVVVKVAPRVEVKAEPRIAVTVEPRVQVKTESPVRLKTEPRAQARVEPRVRIVAPLVPQPDGVRVEPALAPQVTEPTVPRADSLEPALAPKAETIAPAVGKSSAPRFVPEAETVPAPQAPVLPSMGAAQSLAPTPRGFTVTANTMQVSGAPRRGACLQDLDGRFTGSQSISVTDEGTRVYQRVGWGDDGYMMVKKLDDRWLCMRTSGDVGFDRENGRVESIGREGVVYYSIIEGDDEQTLEMRGPERALTWSVNGREQPVTAEVRAWQSAMDEVVGGYWQTSYVRGQVSSLRGEISSIRGHRSSLRGQISSARGRVSSLRGQMSSARGQVSSLRGEISSLNGQVSSMRGAISSERGAISTLRAQERYADQQDRERIEARIAEHEERIEEIEAQIEEFDLEGRREAVERRIADFDLEGKLAAIEQQIAEFDLEGREAEIEARIEDLDVEGEVERIEAEIEALDADRRVERIEAQLEGALERLEQAIERLR